MSRGGNVRRDWTHRRLGLGAMKPGDAQLAHTDALLTAVGARDGGSFGGDPLAAALLDFVYDIDLAAGVSDLDARPLPADLLRLTPSGTPQRRRMTWSVLVPAMGTAIAAIVVATTVLIGRGNPAVVSPSATATVESHQLLVHAESLIADAKKASVPAQRKRLVSEARADLTHVSHLLPLAPADQRPAIRRQLFSLEQRVAPPPPAGTSDGLGSFGSGHGATTGGSSGGSGTSGQSGSGGGAGTGTLEPTPLPTQTAVGQRPLSPPIRPVPTNGQGTGGQQDAAPTTAPNPNPQQQGGGGLGDGRQGPPPSSGGRQGQRPMGSGGEASGTS